MLMQRRSKDRTTAAKALPPELGSMDSMDVHDSDEDTEELLALVEQFEASQKESQGDRPDEASAAAVFQSEPKTRRSSGGRRSDAARADSKPVVPRRSPRKSKPVSPQQLPPSKAASRGSGVRDISNATHFSRNSGAGKAKAVIPPVLPTKPLKPEAGSFENKRLQALIRRKKREAERRRAAKLAQRIVP